MKNTTFISTICLIIIISLFIYIISFRKHNLLGVTSANKYYSAFITYKKFSYIPIFGEGVEVYLEIYDQRYGNLIQLTHIGTEDLLSDISEKFISLIWSDDDKDIIVQIESGISLIIYTNIDRFKDTMKPTAPVSSPAPD